jgi:hypothetical protein
MKEVDWNWKIREVIERIRTRYDHIGRKTGAPFLAVVYPPEVEREVLKELRLQMGTLGSEFIVKAIDVLAVTQSITGEIGTENIVATFQDPMPGSEPATELGQMWVNAVAEQVRKAAVSDGRGKIVVVLEHLAALFPVAGPRAVMQQLWDHEQSCLDGPVIVLIPGSLKEPRWYLFVDSRGELMYRGDIL